MPQHGAELMISGKNPAGYFYDSKAAAIQTDSNMFPARK